MCVIFKIGSNFTKERPHRTALLSKFDWIVLWNKVVVQLSYNVSLTLRIAEISGRQEVPGLSPPHHGGRWHSMRSATQRNVGTFSRHLITTGRVVQDIGWHCYKPNYYLQLPIVLVWTFYSSPDISERFYASLSRDNLWLNIERERRIKSHIVIRNMKPVLVVQSITTKVFKSKLILIIHAYNNFILCYTYCIFIRIA